MTVGSWDRSSFFLFGPKYVGLKATKSWSGTDRPLLVKTYDKAYTVKRYELRNRRSGKPYWATISLRFPKRRVDTSDPPKRARDVDHDYSASWLRESDELVISKLPDGTPVQYAVMQEIGTATGYGVGNCPVFTANDQAKLVQKLRERVLGSDFNLANFVGESLPAIRMITDVAKRISDSLLALKKGNVLKAAHLLVQGTPQYTIFRSRKFEHPTNIKSGLSEKDLSARWLEIQYGWLPLLKDVEAGAHFVAHYHSVPFRDSYRVTRRLEVNGVFRPSQVDGFVPVSSGASPTSRPVIHFTNSTVRTIIARMSERPGVAASLGLLNPETVAWEVTPWSFVIDWFIPIGEYLQARAFANSLTGTFVTSDVKKATQYIDTMNGKSTPNVPRCFWHTGNMTRTISTSLDVGFPVFKPLSSVPSWTRCLNALALLSQRR